MNKNEIIELLANDTELKEICKSITRNNELWQDLYQHALIIMLETPEERIQDLHKNNKSKAFLIKIMLNEWNNPRSPFQKSYGRNISTTSLKQEMSITYSSDTTSIDVCKFDIDKALQYFVTVTPETIQAARNLERLKSEDHSEKRFPYRTELFKIFLQYGSTRNIQKEVGIHYVSASKTLKQIKEELKK